MITSFSINEEQELMKSPEVISILINYHDRVIANCEPNRDPRLHQARRDELVKLLENLTQSELAK